MQTQIEALKAENDRLRRDNERFVRIIDSGEWGRGRVAELVQVSTFLWFLFWTTYFPHFSSTRFCSYISLLPCMQHGSQRSVLMCVIVGAGRAGSEDGERPACSADGAPKARL